MAVTPSELIELRDALIRARARGVRIVQVNGEKVEYKTDREMADAIADLEARITRASGHPRPQAVRFNSSKGF
ncbi:MAG: hypothetical protein R3E47_04795 [Paracoccaceae bacterium]